MGPCMSSGEINTKQGIKGTRVQIGKQTFILQQKIANGAYGDVWKCKDVQNSKLYAIKQIKLQNKQLQQMYNKETMWLQKLSRVLGIVKYQGSRIINIQNNKDERYSSTGFIVTQFYQTNLFDELRNRKFSSWQVRDILNQLIKTLKQIHSLGCLHLDLKLQNILCKMQNSGHMSYHICDFGSCCECPIKVKELQKKQKIKLKQYIQTHSTLIYRAPQMIQPDKLQLNEKTDVWMLGCVIYLLLYRKHPFQGQGQLGIITANIDYSIQPQLSDFNNNNEKGNVEKIIKCLKGMLNPNMQERLNQNQILQIIRQ